MLQEFFQLFSAAKSPSVNSDTLVSKFVYRFLFWYLLSCFLFVTFLAKNNGKMYCYTDDSKHAILAHECCSSQGVYIYTDPSEEEAAKLKHKESHPGVRGVQPVLKTIFPGIRPQTEPESEKHFNFFYTNSPVYFLLMAASCYVGRLFWRKSQGQLLLDIIGNLKHTKTARPSTDRNQLQTTQDIEEAARILFESVGQHRWYFIKYIVSESLNCFVLLSHLFTITVIGGIGFWVNGFRIFYYINVPCSEWPHEVAKEFPMVAKCDMKHYGYEGNEVVHGALCFLHFNHVVQLLFVVHWLFDLVLVVACIWSAYHNYRALTDRIILANQLLSVLYQSAESPLYPFLINLTPGTSFVVLLLSKNLSPHVVVRILLDFRMEINARGNEFADRLAGL